MLQSAQNNPSNGRPDVALASILHGRLKITIERCTLEFFLKKPIEDAQECDKNMKLNFLEQLRTPLRVHLKTHLKVYFEIYKAV